MNYEPGTRICIQDPTDKTWRPATYLRYLPERKMGTKHYSDAYHQILVDGHFEPGWFCATITMRLYDAVARDLLLT